MRLKSIVSTVMVGAMAFGGSMVAVEGADAAQASKVGESISVSTLESIEAGDKVAIELYKAVPFSDIQENMTLIQKQPSEQGDDEVIEASNIMKATEAIELTASDMLIKVIPLTEALQLSDIQENMTLIQRQLSEQGDDEVIEASEPMTDIKAVELNEATVKSSQ
ncbi:hypothetical protein G4V62_12065 [Bacillaceae bacterium SIJ1]|uniref:hypothetical protein n=1 Tax=Litoribacterium kuwaitense TaxID=1398745 RepID=UPI0013ED4655|nr:hypothetical protein [Litoribacterium kuwaitense]NGP45657.1 hypothetical protein [Litoribacterium kuwaitense]